ncbi:MAG: xanthine dehydrogenase family protein molybdopterin-binding subunit [Verrucomicrobia bacterium]|nr:xanthine dehydrogenase family protein molybdopterin-binding subunit [Verrucomicrobiota bacterium]
MKPSWNSDRSGARVMNHPSPHPSPLEGERVSEGRMSGGDGTSRTRWNMALPLNRRALLKLLGGGILVFIYSPRSLQAQDKLPSGFIQIGPEGTITLLTGKIEMGQGVITSLAQMAAEELDVPLSAMRVLMGDTQLCPADADGGTWGSLTTRNFGPSLRSAAARARAILVQLASEQLGVPKDQLFTREGFVLKRSDENVLVSYASLAGGKNVETHLTQTPVPKAFTQFTLSGKPAPRIDAIEKVTGQARYAADIRLPGMLYARILRPPARGAKLKSADMSEAEKVPGVRVVRTGTLLAVLHEQPDIAEQALALVKAEYDLPQSGPDDESIDQYLLGRAPTGQIVGQKGSVLTGEQLATSKLAQTYYTPYVAHAPIEPHAAVASMEAGRLTVWASTQTPSGTRSETGAARVITPYVGGGFGGKISNQQAIEAAQLARAVGKPVNVTWTREEEFFYDTFQCPSIIKINSGLDQNNRITFWDYQVYFAGDRGAAFFYDVPHYRVRRHGTYSEAQPFAGGPWRAPGANANCFARESHIDALAAAARVDPLEFRLLHLKNTRVRQVLEKAAENFGWQPAKPSSGRGFGVACGEDAGAYVAMMAEVAVDQKSGTIQVKRILCAQDMGQVINPEGARMQMEGGMMMGLGYSLSEELHFSNGSILDLNFHKYHIPRFSSMPKLETVIVQNNALSPQGGGEPPIITTGAVLANAVFDAIGVRLNRLPMTSERVLAALRSRAPTLNAPERSGDQLRLTWNGGPGVKLQKSASLNNPVWQDVPDTDGRSSVSLPLADGAAYFRLVKP